jgi:hypothetical protein
MLSICYDGNQPYSYSKKRQLRKSALEVEGRGSFMSLPGVSSLRRAVEVVAVMLISGAVGNALVHRHYAPDLSVPPPVNFEHDVQRFKAEDAARAAAAGGQEKFDPKASARAH